jgi:pimeloyl-ACP methyl ester carboxylesterase
MTDGFRASAEHATDIAAMIALLRQRAPVPVWLVGTSRGTISAASIAARLGSSRVAGLVLTSTVWADLSAVTPLDQVRVPTLVVHNRDDGCAESPFSLAANGVAALRGAPVKALIAVSGGISRSAPCQALSPHGYYGIEDQVVPPIVAWIEAH